MHNISKKSRFYGWDWEDEWVLKYLVSLQDKVIVRKVVAELNGNLWVYIIPKEAAHFALNRLRNSTTAIAGFVKIINYFI